MSKIYSQSQGMQPLALLAVVLAFVVSPSLADNVTIISAPAPAQTSNYAAPMPASQQTLGTLPVGGANPASIHSVMTSDDQVEPIHQGNITYMTGGVGDEERSALDEAKKDYNLHITSASASGAFSGEVQISLYDHSGNQVLSAPAGPIFLAALPPGNYRVEASANGKTSKRNVNLSRGKNVSLHFTW